MAKCLNCLVWTLGILSGLSVALYFYFNSLVETAVRSQLVLAEGNPLWEKWIKVPIGFANYRYTFFEVMNPDEALRGAKVMVRERGPFCFKHMRYKKILGWGPNNETVRYMEYKQYFYDPGCSGENSLDDTFYMINPLFAALGQTIGDMIETQLPMAPLTAPVAYTMINAVMDSHGQTLFFKKSVRDILFGFKINLLETMDTFIKPLKQLGIRFDALPENPPDNMFGLMYGRNDTPEGEHEIYTGQSGTSKIFGYFASHKGKKSLPFWKGDKCNEIRGSDGTLFPPFVTEKTVLSAFAMDLCRSFDFSSTGWSEYKGIKGLLFGFPSTAFATGEHFPDNECFCMFKGDRKKRRCSTDGTFDLGGCQGGAPLVVSPPHFLHTSPDLSKGVDGLNPDESKHGTYLIVQPTVGAPIFGIKKLQFGIRIERVPYLRNLQGVRSAVIPFVYAEESGGLNDELADELKGMLINPLYYAEIGIAGVALVSTFTFIFLLLLRMFGGNGAKKRVSETESVENLVKNEIHSNRSLPSTTPPVPPPPPPMPSLKNVSVQTPDRLVQSNAYVNNNGYNHNGNGYIQTPSYNDNYPNSPPNMNGHINGGMNGHAPRHLKHSQSTNSFNDSRRGNESNERWKGLERDAHSKGVWTTGTGQFVNSTYNNNVRGTGNGVLNGNGNNNAKDGPNLMEELANSRSFRKRQQSDTSLESGSSKSSTSTGKTVTISKDQLRNPTPPDTSAVTVVEEDAAKREILEGLFDAGVGKDDNYEEFTGIEGNDIYPNYIKGLEIDDRRKNMHTPVNPN